MIPGSPASEPPPGLVPGGTLTPGTGVQVVVPCHDDGEFLAECLASVAAAVAAAGPGPVEVTIVDDGSTAPATLAVLDAHRAAGWHVVRTPGLGIPAARNAGAATSVTAAVLPLDVDNRLLPALLGAVGLVESGAADVVHGPWREFGDRTGVVVPPPDPADALRPLNQIDNCALYARSALTRVGGWDDAASIWEDWDLLLRLHAAGAHFVQLADVTFEYRVRAGSVQGRWWDAMCAGPVLGKFVARHPLLADFHRRHPHVYSEQFADTPVDLGGLVRERSRLRRVVDPIAFGGPRRRRFVARLARTVGRGGGTVRPGADGGGGAGPG